MTEPGKDLDLSNGQLQSKEDMSTESLGNNSNCEEGSNRNSENEPKEATILGYFSFSVNIQRNKEVDKVERLNWYYERVKEIDKDFQILPFDEGDDSTLTVLENKEQITNYFKNIQIFGSAMKGGF